MTDFRYGIEHECALLHLDGSFADFTDVGFDVMQAIVDALPTDPADYPQLRVGDQGIKYKRWYVEGYEHAEAAALCACSLATIKRRVQRAEASVRAFVGAGVAERGGEGSR